MPNINVNTKIGVGAIGSVANATSEGQLMKITKSFLTIIFCVVITGCMSIAKKETETPPELLELLNGLKVSYQIEKTDIEYIQDYLDESRETKSNINSAQFIDMLSGVASVQALPRTEQQNLLRGTAYLLDNIELLDELIKTSGAISEPFAEFFLNGSTGHYYLPQSCTATNGTIPPIYKKEWFAFGCPATNGTVCNWTSPQTYTLYWCDE